MRACYPNQLDYMGPVHLLPLALHKKGISIPSSNMPIDINLLRAFKGGVPDLVRLSQAKRFAKVELVDEVIALDDVTSTFGYYAIAVEKTCKFSR